VQAGAPLAAARPGGASTATSHAATPAEVARRIPRAPSAPVPPPKRRRLRRTRRVVGPLVVIGVLLAAIGAGGWVATQAVYFVGADDEGFVTLYRGVPYELPFGLKLYSENYTSGVAMDTLAPRVRATVTDHKLRARRDAADLVGQIELGRLAGQAAP
jgi:protein phosphatase